MRKHILIAVILCGTSTFNAAAAAVPGLTVSPAETLEGRGVSVLVDQNHFSPIFFDEKNAGIQIILHGERIAADGDVRLNPTPEQWDPVPAFIDRSRRRSPNQFVVRVAYPARGTELPDQVTAEG